MTSVFGSFIGELKNSALPYDCQDVMFKWKVTGISRTGGCYRLFGMASLQPRLGTKYQFAAVREFLSQAGYGEQAVLKRLGLNGLHEYLSRGGRAGAPAPAEVEDTLDVLVRLFLAGSSVSRELVGRLIPSGVQGFFEALGILCTHSAHPDECYSQVALYPVQELFIASDQWRNQDGSAVPMVNDYVLPAIHRLTHEYLELLPQSPCAKLLDLCSGTAIAALLASKYYARQSWAVDITERATQFGEFNRLLNDLNNTTVLQGNLYEPLGDVVFDRIVAHPPYVPTLDACAIHADGGEDGEFITRAIVEGLPRFLEPGGRFYCTTMGLDREGEPYEQRVRQWLGSEQSAFDVLFVAGTSQGPNQFAYRMTRSKKGSWEMMDRWRTHLEKLRVKSLVYGLLVIQRKEISRRVFTVQRQKGEHAGAAVAEWLLSLETCWSSENAVERVLQSRPLACPNLEVHGVQTKRNGEFASSKFMLRTRYPFQVEYDCPAWVATFVMQCDGKSTALEHFEAGKRDQWIPPDLSLGQFGDTVGQLVSRGILEIEGLEPPQLEKPGQL
jgi:SAM-dependent methyltransferase